MKRERDKPGRYTPPRSHPGTPRVPPLRTAHTGHCQPARHAAAPVVWSTRTRRRPLLGLLLTRPGRAWERSQPCPMPQRPRTRRSVVGQEREPGTEPLPRSRSWSKQQQATEKEEAVAVPVPLSARSGSGVGSGRAHVPPCAGCGAGPVLCCAAHRPFVPRACYPDSGRRGCGCGSRGRLTCMRSRTN